jgi:hypothetical protein
MKLNKLDKNSHFIILFWGANGVIVFPKAGLALEAIADSALGQDVTRLKWVFFHFLA